MACAIVTWDPNGALAVQADNSLKKVDGQNALTGSAIGRERIYSLAGGYISDDRWADRLGSSLTGCFVLQVLTCEQFQS